MGITKQIVNSHYLLEFCPNVITNTELANTESLGKHKVRFLGSYIFISQSIQNHVLYLCVSVEFFKTPYLIYIIDSNIELTINNHCN